jgi:outer membrane lipoprotein SlyB
MKTLRHWLFGVLATLLVCTAEPGFAQAAASGPRVDGFDVEEVAELTAGTALHFTLYGTPGAAATLSIAGADGSLPLQETQAGIYEGSYTIAADDQITADSRVTADLRAGERVASAVLDEPLVLGATAAVPVAAISSCNVCGVVQSIRPVEARADAGIFGALAGGVVGAILGSQVGQGDGRTAAGILGAVGGAYAGREIERASRGRTRFDLVVRMDDGGVQTRRYDATPPFKVGDRVRVLHDRLLHDRPLREAGPDPR